MQLAAPHQAPSAMTLKGSSTTDGIQQSCAARSGPVLLPADQTTPLHSN